MFYVYRYDHSILRMSIGYLNDIWCCLGFFITLFLFLFYLKDMENASVSVSSTTRHVYDFDF